MPLSCSTSSVMMKYLRFASEQPTGYGGMGLNKIGHELVNAETVGYVYEDSHQYSLYMSLKLSVAKKNMVSIIFF